MFAAAYYELFVVGLAHCDGCRFLATLVASVKGYEVVAATASDPDANLAAVAYYKRPCAHAVGLTTVFFSILWSCEH